MFFVRKVQKSSSMACLWLCIDQGYIQHILLRNIFIN